MALAVFGRHLIGHNLHLIFNRMPFSSFSARSGVSSLFSGFNCPSFFVNKKKQGLWALVPLLMAVGPIAVYVFAGVWAWWLWLLILGLYILSAVFYYNSLNQETNSHAWRRAMLFLTLLVLVLEIAMARHLPGW